MARPSWKTGGSWVEITAAACTGTWAGSWRVEYPPAIDTAHDGAPCGAVGRPQIVIESTWLTDTGMAFWRAPFAGVTATYASISIEAFDPRTGALSKWLGRLHWPTFSGLGVGATAGQTIYTGVRILITDCVETT